MIYLYGSLIVIFSWLGVLLTIVGLPGMWVALLVSGISAWLEPSLVSIWTLVAYGVIALAGEIVEFAAGAAGAAKAGGTRRGSLGAIAGGLIGAIAGSFFIPIPILGTILGSAVGAGLGAMLAERHGRKTWAESTKIGAGAAAGRFVATIAKAVLAAAGAIVLCVAVCIG